MIELCKLLSVLLIEVGHAKADEPQQHQNISDDSAAGSLLDKNAANEDDSKVSQVYFLALY